MSGGGKRGCGTGHDAGQPLVEIGRERAHAEEAAAAGARLMAARRKRMVIMMNVAPGIARAMVHYVGMGQALDRMIAMAEGEHRRRQNEAKRRDSCKNQRKLKADAPNEWDEH